MEGTGIYGRYLLTTIVKPHLSTSRDGGTLSASRFICREEL
jgi:hypothetical protein